MTTGRKDLVYLVSFSADIQFSEADVNDVKGKFDEFYKDIRKNPSLDVCINLLDISKDDSLDEHSIQVLKDFSVKYHDLKIANNYDAKNSILLLLVKKGSRMDMTLTPLERHKYLICNNYASIDNYLQENGLTKEFLIDKKVYF